MKAAVFSDTHGKTDVMVAAIAACRPDMVIHLGDCERDTRVLSEKFPEIPLYAVCGNCDMNPTQPLARVVQIGSAKALICHGHSYGVNYGTDRLAYAAMEQGAQIAMYGHTHAAENTQVGSVHILNPGTAGKGYRLSWATVEVLENGAIACQIHWEN